MTENYSTAGDRFLLRFAPAEFSPAAGWSMAARLVSRASGGSVIDISAVPQGDTFLFDVAAAITADWAAGDYTLSVWVTLGPDVRTICQAQFTVLPNPRNLVAGHDGRSLATRTLERLKEVLAEWASSRGHVRRYKVNEREMEFNSSAEITAQIRYWEGAVAKELDQARRDKGGKRRNRIVVRFTNPR